MPNKNLNLWSHTSCNRLVEERIKNYHHKKHIEELQHGKGVTDHHPPEAFPHLRAKGKKQKLQEDRAAEIQNENRILLQKMLTIDTKPSQFGVESSFARVAPRSMHGQAHRRELDRITSENQAMLTRLQGAKSEFDIRGLEEMEMDRQALKHRMCQNSCRGRPLRLPMPMKPVMSMPNLPRLGPEGARFREDDWARLTNNELDRKLVELEKGSKTDVL